MTWLPPLVEINAHGGDWHRYLDAIYTIFESDFVHTKPNDVAGKRFALKRHPEYQDKACTFWHIISDGKTEESRIPDMTRCARIAWPRPIIDAFDSERIIYWKTERGASTRIVLSVPDFSYVVVLDERADFVLLWTAFYVDREHRRRKFGQEYEAYWADARCS
jgi:hypothetical protein